MENYPVSKELIILFVWFGELERCFGKVLFNMLVKDICNLYKTFFMLNLAEHKIYRAHIC